MFVRIILLLVVLKKKEFKCIDPLDVKRAQYALLRTRREARFSYLRQRLERKVFNKDA